MTHIATTPLSRCVFLSAIFLSPVLCLADVTISTDIPHDGRVSLAIYDQEGRMVRTLLTGKPLAKGKHSITWDGLDRYGHALPAGDYNWKLLVTDGLRAEFITQVGQNVDPAWEKATGNHQSPNAAAVDATGLYRQGSVNEGGHWGVKTDLNGRTLWVNNRNQADPWMGGGESLALVNGRLFELMRDGTVYGSDAASGRVFTGSDTQPKPWNLRWDGYQAPAGTGDDARRKRNIAARPHDLAGDAVNGLLVAAYPQHDAIAWFGARDGRQVDKAEGLQGLAGIAVAPDGTVYAIAQGRVIALSFSDGQWHHVVTTVGPGGQRLHVDGKRIATGNLAKRTKTSNRLGLDLGPGGGDATVAIDELKIIGHALAEIEVIRLSD